MPYRRAGRACALAALRRVVPVLPVGQGTGDGLWRFQEGRPSEIWKAADASLAEPAAVSPGGHARRRDRQAGGETAAVGHVADGTNVRTLAPSIVIRFRGRAPPTGRPTALDRRSRSRRGRGRPLHDSGRCRPPIRLVSGQVGVRCGRLTARSLFTADPSTPAVCHSWPCGRMAPASNCRLADGPRRRPSVPARRTGTGVPAANAVWTSGCSIWRRKASRPLTRLSYHGALGSFDITPDGKRIVFDRSRENSDIVLIERRDERSCPSEHHVRAATSSLFIGPPPGGAAPRHIGHIDRSRGVHR